MSSAAVASRSGRSDALANSRDFMNEHMEAMQTHASVVEGLSMRLQPAALQMKQDALREHYLATGRTGVLTDRHKRFITSLSPEERDALASRITRRSFDIRHGGADAAEGGSILDAFAAEKADNVRSAREGSRESAPALEDAPTRRTLEQHSRLSGGGAGPPLSPFHVSSTTGRPRPVKGTPTASDITTARLRAAGVLQQDAAAGSTGAMGSPPGGASPCSKGGPTRRPPPAALTRTPGTSHEGHIKNMVLSAVPHDVVHVYSPSRFDAAHAQAAAQRGREKYGSAASGTGAYSSRQGFGSPSPRAARTPSRRGGSGTPAASSTQRLAQVTQQPIGSFGEAHPGLVQNQSLRRASLFNATGDHSAWNA